jgi:hypothetical protein
VGETQPAKELAMQKLAESASRLLVVAIVKGKLKDKRG